MRGFVKQISLMAFLSESADPQCNGPGSGKIREKNKDERERVRSEERVVALHVDFMLPEDG